MKYYVVHVSNGELQIDSITEHSTPEAARVNYHQRCAALGNEPSVIKATVKILDEQLDCYNGFYEVITHAQAEETPATPAQAEAETPAQAEAETPAQAEAETPAESAEESAE